VRCASRLSSITTQQTRNALYLALAFGGMAYFAMYAGAYLGSAHPPYDLRGYLVGRDFLNTWMSGCAALGGNPAAWFDVHVYNAALRSVFGLPATFPWYNWSYPPHILLITWIFGLLPFLPAWVLWSIAGYAAYFFTAAQGEQRFDRLAFIAAWPACTINYFCGQNGSFTAALIIGGLSQLEKRPLLAGALFGLLTLKPQLGLLLPIVLILTRSWRCIIAAVATTLALVAITTVIYGIDIWSDYFHVAMHQQAVVLRILAGRGAIALPTAFMNARFFGFSPDLAWLVQAPVSAAAIAAVIWTFWRRRDPVLSQALFVTASFLVTPYIWVYDMVVFGWVAAKLRERGDNTHTDDLVMLGVWALPIMATPFPFHGVPAVSLFLIILMLRLLWRLYRDDSTALAGKANSAQIAFARASL
jgi:hypothetical protein